jgi:hypothetical protein
VVLPAFVNEQKPSHFYLEFCAVLHFVFT